MHHVMKTWESGGIDPPLLTSALRRGEWPAWHSIATLPWGKSPGTHWTGGWVGPRASLDAVEKRKISCHARNQIPVIKPVAITILTELSQLTSQLQKTVKSYTQVRIIQVHYICRSHEYEYINNIISLP
jgi:hypothetical protein